MVRDPCDIGSPLSEGSLWPYWTQIFPTSARPDYASPLNRFTETVITIADRFITVISMNPGDAKEGRILEWGVNEVNAAGTTILAGTDLIWRIVIGTGPTLGSEISDFDPMTGTFGSIVSPIVIPLRLERNKFVSLQVFAPAAGGVPRTVRALLRGWTAPFHGGGTFASGAGRS